MSNSAPEVHLVVPMTVLMSSRALSVRVLRLIRGEERGREGLGGDSLRRVTGVRSASEKSSVRSVIVKLPLPDIMGTHYYVLHTHSHPSSSLLPDCCRPVAPSLSTFTSPESIGRKAGLLPGLLGTEAESDANGLL